MLSPLYAAHECDHVEHMEQHESDHAENQCCPPFSFCKVCSLFIYQVHFQLETIEAGIFISSGFAILSPHFLEASFSIWQPPQLI
ncbi:hypothetical protein [Belliella buryatensis]|uniref:hypothetical protein n=1 Tax=Belliella buryatensis TaxID=1500549 RepID=UPI00113159A5|nr:hypothetical protein [Belliella buryatensis]